LTVADPDEDRCCILAITGECWTQHEAKDQQFQYSFRIFYRNVLGVT